MQQMTWTHSETFTGDTKDDDYLRAAGLCNAAKRDREADAGTRLKLLEVDATDADDGGLREVTMTYVETLK